MHGLPSLDHVPVVIIMKRTASEICYFILREFYSQEVITWGNNHEIVLLFRLWTLLVNGWKLEVMFSSLFPVSSSVPNLPNVRFPNVCPEPLKPRSAFCIEHFSKAQLLGYPTDVKGFLSYCGATKTGDCNISQF